MSFCLSANHNSELRCVICTSVTLFAPVLHLNCTALSQSESSNFFMYIIIHRINIYLTNHKWPKIKFKWTTTKRLYIATVYSEVQTSPFPKWSKLKCDVGLQKAYIRGASGCSVLQIWPIFGLVFTLKNWGFSVLVSCVVCGFSPI